MLFALLAPGCSGQGLRPTSGPLGKSAPASDGVLCITDTGGLSFVHSGEVLQNLSDQAVTLESVSLVTPRNTKLVNSFVAATWSEGPSSVSLGSSADELHPAGTETDAGRSAWEQRSDLHGARLVPGQSVSVVVIAERIDREVGSFEALNIDYQGAGGAYRYRTQTRVVLQDAACG